MRHGVKFTPTQPDAMRIESILIKEVEENQQEIAASKEDTN